MTSEGTLVLKVRALQARTVCWRVQVHCYAVALGLPTILALVTVACTCCSGGPRPSSSAVYRAWT